VTWSLGAAIDGKSRKYFNDHFRNLLLMEQGLDPHYSEFAIKNPTYEVPEMKPIGMMWPEDTLVFDYKFDSKKCSWQAWMDICQKYVIPKDAEFQTILVPTIDTERTAFFVDVLLMKGMVCVCFRIQFAPQTDVAEDGADVQKYIVANRKSASIFFFAISIHFSHHPPCYTLL
jgi:hypothetical protein